MALAPYFRRAAVAAAQVIAGFSEEAIRLRLEQMTLGISIGRDALTAEGEALTELTVLLASRLYPRISLEGHDRDRWQEIALSVNPDIEIATVPPTFAICIGEAKADHPAIYVGSDGWDALLSPNDAQFIGASLNPFGAGTAACLALANAFRFAFLDKDSASLDPALRFSALTFERDVTTSLPMGDLNLGDFVIVGAGAIGNSAVWAISKLQATGACHIVDHELIELDNLQRYVLATINDVKSPKVEVASRYFQRDLLAETHAVTWADFLGIKGHAWRRVLVAVDSATARREIQASLPRWIANAWTQSGDLGVSVHPQFGQAACLRCLYLPQGEVPSEDKLIAEALGLRTPEEQMMVRIALFNNDPLPEQLVERVAGNLSVPVELVASFGDKPVRALYVQGLCGGELIPLENLGQRARDVHVPVAHQSALAGVLLASRLVSSTLGLDPRETEVLQIDVLKPIQESPKHLVARDQTGVCICNDDDYRQIYSGKYGSSVLL